MRTNPTFSKTLIALLVALVLAGCESSPEAAINVKKIDRQTVVNRHNPSLRNLDTFSPFTVGNGRFAFTADITGLQSYPDLYYAEGIPLETKVRWGWHSRANPKNFSLADTYERYTAYGREVAFPTNMNSAAGQWLRQNPHDLPLARIGFSLNGKNLAEPPTQANQTLDLWKGQLQSEFVLAGEKITVTTLADNKRDGIAANIRSELLKDQRLAVDIHFPRGYRLDKKNTPDLDFDHIDEHSSTIVTHHQKNVVLQRKIDDATHSVLVQWQGEAIFREISKHHYRLVANDDALIFSVSFSQAAPINNTFDFAKLEQRGSQAWQSFWQSGAFVDFSESSNPLAIELERRVILSRYLMAVQERASIPPQESGLTHSSWYGKHHSEMSWWHSAHWVLWGQPDETEKLLQWYNAKLPAARALAKERGLQGARWAKMIGPDNRESPGGNPLIIWNQPQLIHLAEMVYQIDKNPAILEEYAELVEKSAQAMVSMLVWDAEKKQYNLEAPIWIAQEIYDPRLSKNPTFELAYWHSSLRLAQSWQQRMDKTPPPEWQEVIDKLAPLPLKNEKYVAIESIPDTFDNSESRQDHPSMLAAYGLLNSPRVDKDYMRNTLHAVLAQWDWDKKIWGWDYPMIAMTAARLGETQTAIDILLADKTHNHYMNNGHVPQAGSELRVYLPANGALLAAVAMMLGGWEDGPTHNFPGFPEDGTWSIKAEGFAKLQ